MGVHESQVSRGERNEYHGITVGRVMMILAIAGDCVYIAKGAGGFKVLPIQN